MNGYPSPLVPQNVDLRGYEFMPFYGARLRDSELNSRATDAEFRAAVNLWWSSWNQVPAASLPDNDIDLCKLADLGRDLRAWAKVKDRALHGFVLCSDGRRYHVVLAAIALESWEGRVAASVKGKAGASKRWEKHRQLKQMAQAYVNNGTGNATANENHSKRERSKEKGVEVSGLSISPTRENVNVKSVLKKIPSDPNPADIERSRRVANACAAGDTELAKRISEGTA